MNIQGFLAFRNHRLRYFALKPIQYRSFGDIPSTTNFESNKITVLHFRSEDGFWTVGAAGQRGQSKKLWNLFMCCRRFRKLQKEGFYPVHNVLFLGLLVIFLTKGHGIRCCYFSGVRSRCNSAIGIAILEPSLTTRNFFARIQSRIVRSFRVVAMAKARTVITSGC